MIEYRAFFDNQFEIREKSNGMNFTGYAAVFNSPSEPLPFIETIAPGAFKRSLDSRNEVKMFVNHNSDQVLASRRAGTLSLSEDSRGLLAEATLPDTTYARDLVVLMNRGDVSSMSFGFTVPANGDSWDGNNQRTLNEVRLHEVSVVTGFPAYEATTAQVRSIDVLAERTKLDADELAVALTLLDNGASLTPEQADLVSAAARALSMKFDEASRVSLGFLEKRLALSSKR